MTPRSEAAAAAEPSGGSGRLRLSGGCHCGNLALTFETARAPGELAVRACGCSFCRRHSVRAVSDPRGRVEFVVQDPLRLNRYRFVLGTAQFLVCRTCSVYVGALMADGGSAYATVNIISMRWRYPRCSRFRSATIARPRPGGGRGAAPCGRPRPLSKPPTFAKLPSRARRRAQGAGQTAGRQARRS
jgi:hypothetical protein